MKADVGPRQIEGCKITRKNNTCVCGPWLAVLACVLSTGSCLCTIALYQEVRSLRVEVKRQNTLSPGFIPSSPIQFYVQKTSLPDTRREFVQNQLHNHAHFNFHNVEQTTTDISDFREKRETRDENKRHCSCPKGEKGPRGKKGKNGKRGKKGKRGQKGPRGEKGEKGEKGMTLPIRDMQSGISEYQPKNVYRHVHFISDFNEDVSQDGFKGKNCQEIFGGKACRNRSFTATVVPEKFRFLKNRDEHSNVTSLPVSQSDDGMYHIHQTGTYLVYLHAALWSVDNTGSDVFAVVLDRRSAGRPSTVFHCRPLNNNWTGNHYDNLLQTCVSTRTLHLVTNDVISIYLESSEATIDLTKGETYFGVLRLS